MTYTVLGASTTNPNNAHTNLQPQVLHSIRLKKEGIPDVIILKMMASDPMTAITLVNNMAPDVIDGLLDAQQNNPTHRRATKL